MAPAFGGSTGSALMGLICMEKTKIANKNQRLIFSDPRRLDLHASPNCCIHNSTALLVDSRGKSLDFRRNLAGGCDPVHVARSGFTTLCTTAKTWVSLALPVK
jgi:hypothetical protein